MRQSIVLALVFVATVATGACGKTELLLEVDRRNITAGGIDYAVITATFGRSGEVVAGETLHFETTAGSFNEQDPDQQEADVATDARGRAQIKLFSSPGPDTATVTVTHENASSDTTTAQSITIRFGEPSGSDLPLGDSVRLVCDAANIGALRHPVPDIRVRCTLNAQTVDGRTIPLSALNPLLFAEAGTLVKEPDELDGTLTLVYTPKGGSASPADVKPATALGEPEMRGAGNKTLNPRDGLVTLMAVVTAQEPFSDDNGNGTYDEGEDFIDTPEPFLDVDDDGKRDPDERFVDVDGNGQWDDGNDTWDQEAAMMAMYKVLWTGPLWNDPSKSSKYRSRVLSGEATSTLSITVLAIAVDKNLNPIAGFPDNADELQWTVDGSGVTAASATEVAVKNSYGFEFDKTKDQEVDRWVPLGQTFSPEPYRLELRAQPEDESLNAVISAELFVSPGPRGADDYIDQISERIEETLPLAAR